ASVQALNLRGGFRHHSYVPTLPTSESVSRAIQFRIVNDHRHAVFGVTIIQLDELGAGVHRELEGRQCVLRRKLASATMANHQWPLTSDQPQGGQTFAFTLSWGRGPG